MRGPVQRLGQRLPEVLSGRAVTGGHLRRRPVVAATLVAVLLGSVAACTDQGQPDPAPSPGLSTAPSTTVQARPAALQVQVARVAGRLDRQARAALERNVGAVVGRYFDDAFLGGTYPRSDFSAAFTTFTDGAAARARRDRTLLTNAALGGTTENVTARRQDVRLDVLAPHRVAAGVTARVHLAYLAASAGHPDVLVRITGRLMLTRKRSGGWEIFGYDLARSVVPEGTGASQ